MKKVCHFIMPLITLVFCVFIIYMLQLRKSQSIMWSGQGLNIITTTVSTETRDIRLNINNATADELASIPGIGPEIAKRIVAYREKRKTFTMLDELLWIDGITQSKLDDIEDYLTIG